MALYAQLDCAFARNPKLIIAGPMPRLMYVQAVLYCRENLTDGVIDRVVLPLVAIDVPHAKKHMDRLVEVGVLEAHPCGWQFPSETWRKWNPLRAEVDEKRAKETERKASYRDRKKRDEDVPAGQSRAVGTRDRQPEPEPEPKEEPEPKPSSLRPQHEQTFGAVRLGADERTSTLEAVAERIADARGLRNRGNNPTVYFARCVQGVIEEVHDQVHDLLSENPLWDADRIADRILHPPRPSAFPAHWPNTKSGIVREEDYA